MCTSQFHLWYATLTNALSFTSPWDLSFATVDYNCHLDLSFAPLGCSPSSHIGVALAICISRFQPQVQLSWEAFVHTSQLQLSLESLVQLPCVPFSFTAQLNLSFVPFAFTCRLPPILTKKFFVRKTNVVERNGDNRIIGKVWTVTE